MVRIVRFSIIFSCFLIIFGCNSKKHSITKPQNEVGTLPLSISLSALEEHDIQITQAKVTLTKDDDERIKDLLINNSSASGTVNDLNPGIWHILIQLFVDSYVVADGETDVEVKPGQTSNVQITLDVHDITGDVNINVDWNFLTNTPEKILFIGNSYTYSNGGLENILSEYLRYTPASYIVEVESITGGGMTLQNHYNNQNTLNEITNGAYDVVILQEQSQMPYLETETFLQYANLLDDVIDASGAQTVFFMTWAREYDQTQIQDLSDAYNQAGEQTDGIVVPVGEIFNDVYTNHNDINLYVGDGSHPSACGSYLAAITFYKKLWNPDECESSYVLDNVSQEEALILNQSVDNWFNVNNK